MCCCGSHDYGGWWVGLGVLGRGSVDVDDDDDDGGGLALWRGV